MLDLALQLGSSSTVLIREDPIQESVGRSTGSCGLVSQNTAWFQWIFAVEFDDVPGLRSRR